MSRSTISTFELFELFPNAESARVYLEKSRWNGKVVCPHCGCFERITIRRGKRLGYYRCRDCSEEFTVRTGTIFERSHVPLHKWIYAMYLVVTSRKGISSLQLGKEIGVRQATAWFMLGRLREACGDDIGKLSGTIEVDEVFVGGKEKNKHANKKLNAGRGTVGKQAVLGMRQRGGKSVALPVDSTDKKTLHSQIIKRIEQGSTVYTDEHRGYEGLEGYRRGTVHHSAQEYVGSGDISVNGVESMWAVLKRGLYGTWHHVTFKHLGRYINECTFRLNEGNVKVHTLDRLDAFLGKAFRHQITYEDLTA